MLKCKMPTIVVGILTFMTMIAQLVERQLSERGDVGSNPGHTIPKV